MTLILELSRPDRTSSAPTRQVFSQDGGTIGRAAGNDWVLTHNKVSGQHAVISCRSGIFYIQDVSRNGVSVNSPDNRLVANRPYALKSGDRIFIEPYEIDVVIDLAEQRGRRASNRFESDDPFPQDPLGPGGSSALPGPVPVGDDVLDPLDLFPPVVGSPPPRRPEAGAADSDPLNEHYQPPEGNRVVPRASSEPSGVPPSGYDPTADDPSSGLFPPLPMLPANPPGPRPEENEVPFAELPTIPPRSQPVRRPSVGRSSSGARRAVDLGRPEESAGQGLAELLAAAGLKGAPVTPELTRNLGEILRVVVEGLMDVLQARHRIKDEFRMRQTTFRPADNNPLKFSANVEDALHNLLVKRNPAYLGPVDAFAEAFDDLRGHQLAMLEGMRVAFDATLAESDPDRLQEKFDQQLSKAGLALVPAKLRYWDLYRETRRELIKDPAAAFSRLFGEPFARAYEDQFRKIRKRRQRSSEPKRPPAADE